ncbi:MAG: beta-propeller domain-containing protein [Lysinibacillus sp.]
MNNMGKWYVGGVISFILVAAFAIVYFVSPQLQVYATSTIFENQTFYAKFNESLKKDSVTNNMIYIEDADGNKIKATLSVDQDGKTLVVKDLPKGKYTIHVAEKAFKKNVKSEVTVTFSVVDELEAITSLDDLKTYFEAIVNEEEQAMRRNNWEVKEESANVESETSSASDTASHSETNNQVDGIEEGDIAVTDGQYIYSLRDDTVFITDTAKMKVASKIELKDKYPSKLLIHDNKLIVLYDRYIGSVTEDHRYAGTVMTQIAIYDVTNRAKPKLIREVGQEGYQVGVREYDDILYVVTNMTPHYWLIREGEEVELRPQLYDSKDEALTHVSIDKIHIFPGSNEANYTIISAIDLNEYETAEMKVETYLGAGSGIYMSTEAIYMTAPVYTPLVASTRSSMDLSMLVRDNNTDLYKFAVDGTKVEMTARTTIEGSVLNQFSMDEYNGYLRVATTTGNAWGSDGDSNNNLMIYDGNLNEVGKLTDLARGERIYSARFMGDKAYIVTFRETDPLFVIDVADPKNPVVLGELKIPGFSNYLHPLDDTHLIGIGYDTKVEVNSYSKQPIVYTMGMKISLFDVTDVDNPIEVDNEIIGGRGTYSDVQYDHKALYRDQANGHYGFPISIYDEEKYIGSGALVYHITPNGIELAGDFVKKAQGEQYEDWETMVRRLLYIDNTLYTIANHEITAYDKQKFEKRGSVVLK